MKHASLIIAHGNWKQLMILLKQIDDKDNDIYIHIDAKVKNAPIDEIKEQIKESRICIIQKYKVYWGSFELVKTEIELLKTAIKNNYDYYHLLSGTDMMIKSKAYAKEFFEKNNGYEFVHFDTDERLKEDKEVYRRTACYHFFTNYRKRFRIKALNYFFTFIERCSLATQVALGIDRTKKYNFTIKYGSQWFSITDKLAKYIVMNEEKINKIFNKTKCADELFVQTIIYNSKFKEKLYDKNFDDSCLANMRLIDIKNRGKDGSPYTWQIQDYNEINESKCLFARKFDMNKDKLIVEKILKNTMGEKYE